MTKQKNTKPDHNVTRRSVIPCHLRPRQTILWTHGYESRSIELGAQFLLGRSRSLGQSGVFDLIQFDSDPLTKNPRDSACVDWLCQHVDCHGVSGQNLPQTKFRSCVINFSHWEDVFCANVTTHGEKSWIGLKWQRTKALLTNLVLTTGNFISHDQDVFDSFIVALI